MRRKPIFIAALVVFASCYLFAARTSAQDKPTADKPADKPLNTLTPEEEKAGWKLLWDGKTMNGWRTFKKTTVTPNWTIEDGYLKCQGTGGDLITVDKYDVFELSLEYNIGKGGNSGVIFHLTEEENQTYLTGPEIQVQDNKDGADPQKSGWLYQLYKSEVDATHPAGEWNQMHLLLAPPKQTSTLWMNGTKYYDFELGTKDWDDRVAKSKFNVNRRFGKSDSGYIALQEHGGVVKFRNIKIRVIDPKSTDIKPTPDPAAKTGTSDKTNTDKSSTNQSNTSQSTTDKTADPAKAEPVFILGADISAVQAAEARGVKYSDNGTQKDILEIMKDHGFNYVRLRTFVDPTKATPRDRPYSAQGYCDLAHTVTMAKRVKAAGMGLLIDFHYSDSWADPGKQYTPSAWADLSFDDLVKKTHDYTKDAIEQMKAAGGKPDMVQIGNEITPGMMTDHGGSTRNWVQLGRLLKAGIAGVREVDPKIEIMLHIDKGGDNAATRRWFDAAIGQGVEFDILGESCYTRWQGPAATWKRNFEDLVVRYPKLKFCIAEIAADVRESADVMRSLPDHKGIGTFIWEPTQNNNQQGLFDNRGNVLAAKMGVYDQIVKDFGLKK